MRGLVQLRWFQFGDKYLFQNIGIPIGGPVSGAVLEAVLSVDEYLFEKSKRITLSKTLGLKGPHENWFAIVRYVDDIFVATRWFCPDCVEHIITFIYAGTVSFDKTCDELTTVNNYASVKFLDSWCYMSWQSQFFALINKNDLFSISGLLSLKP